MSHRAIALVGCVVLSLASSAHAEGPMRASSAVRSKQPAPVALANVPAPNGGVAWGRAEGVIEARPEEIIAVLHDYSQYAGLFPHFEKSRVLSKRGTDAIVYLEASILHGVTTLWGQVRMSSTSPGPQTRVIEAKMMKGKGNMAQLLARWEVTAIDDGARAKVAFQLLVDPALPVPDAIVSREMKNSAGMAFRALRKRVGQGAVLAARANTSM